MLAQYTQHQLDAQHRALEERLTGLNLDLAKLAKLAQHAEDARAQVRIALSQLEDLRTDEQAHARAVEQDAKPS